ncbi:MAG: efflux transporter periplasmic adaptor subunit [Planctomycetes bacterium]|nr:efflux transporter periplasmic adaptor subunit [Planctomycetota bacterium]HJO26469.1 efflux RND transporter periplasmic adaptor subunit [Planctomycetota bacterium]
MNTTDNNTGAHNTGTSRGFGRLLALLSAALLGYALHALTAPSPGEHTQHGEPRDAAPVQWSCSMHPQIILPEPGDCPICGMDLTPVNVGGGGAGSPDRALLRTSPESRALMQVQTFPVERRFVDRQLPLVGRVAVDDTRLVHLTAWVGGRLDRLFVDSTGVPVIENDHMVSIYSPELVAAQEELLAALATSASGTPGLPATLSTSYAAAAREKLRLLGLADQQLADIEASGQASEHITILAPRSGTVIEQHVFEGMYVKTGTRLFTIADLSRVWVLLDAYEADLPWLRYGQEVSFRTDSVPGELFTGRIGLIDPLLDPKTRTVKVRVHVDNSVGLLKPEMFVRAEVSATVAGKGRVLDPQLAGSFICPMHPEVMSADPGACTECGMDLVSAEELGFATLDADAGGAAPRAPLVIPRSAALITGRRAVVYVELPPEADADSPSGSGSLSSSGPSGIFEGREIVLGPRAGAWLVVKRGLLEGERVVVNGNFKIDSALQIQARPSMMSMAGDDPSQATAPARLSSEALEVLERVLAAYLALQEHLAGDDLTAARTSTAHLVTAFGDSLPEVLRDLADRAATLAAATDMDALRVAFQPVSNGLAPLLAELPSSALAGSEALVRAHCPMAFDFAGADWIQRGKGILNPYFGDEMLTCGSVVEFYSEASASDVEGVDGADGADGAATPKDGTQEHAEHGASEAHGEDH